MSDHILLVDDSTTVRMVIAAELREAGFRVMPVPTLDSARRALNQHRDKDPFSLAILDLQLPDGDGIDLLREIRRDPAYTDLPVMILSSDARLASRLRGLGVGADDFVGKPHSKAYLVGRARTLTGAHPTEQDPHPTEPYRVLVIDADAGLRETLARLLRVGHGVDIVSLDNTDQAAQYLEVEGTGVDCAVVERKSFLRALGLLQGKRPNGVPVIVLDESRSVAWPPPNPAQRRGTPGAALIIPRSLEPTAIAEAILHRLQETTTKTLSSSATIPVDAIDAARRLARGA